MHGTRSVQINFKHGNAVRIIEFEKYVNKQIFLKIIIYAVLSVNDKPQINLIKNQCWLY